MLLQRKRTRNKKYFKEKKYVLNIIFNHCFLASSIIQILFIIIMYVRKKKTNNTMNVKEEYKRNMRLIIKIIIAIIISIIIAVITFYVIGIAEIAFLRQGH